jgi:hypothetical protein
MAVVNMNGGSYNPEGRLEGVPTMGGEFWEFLILNSKLNRDFPSIYRESSFFISGKRISFAP